MKSLSKEQKGVSLALLSGIFYGFLGYFGVTIISNCDCSVTNMLFWRFAITSIIVFLIALPEAKSLKNLALEISLSFCIGVVFYGSSSILYFVSSKYIGTGIAMVIYIAYPIFVILINSVLYKNKITNYSLLAILLLIVGMSVLADITGSNINFFGLAFGFLAALAYAFYIVISKNIKLSANLGTLTVSLGSATTCLIIAACDGSLAFPSNGEIWLNLMGISIICTALPILFIQHALKYISSEKASLLSVTEPLFVIIISIIFLGETITIFQSFGIALTIAGVLVALLNAPASTKSSSFN